MGMLFNLRGMKKLFSFIEKVFSKSHSHFRISAIFGEFGVIFWRFLQEIFVGMLFNLRGLENVFFYRKNDFPNL